MNIFIVNGKQFPATGTFEKLSGLTFKSGVAHTEVNFENNLRSITDLIVCCIASGLSEKEIASKFNIDIVSIQGKVNLKKTKQSQNEKYFELKKGIVCLTDTGHERFNKIVRK